MSNAQVQALAQELVDYISGEPKRFEEEQAAKMKNKGQDENARKARLTEEVSMKIGALLTAMGESADDGGKKDAAKAAAPAHKP